MKIKRIILIGNGFDRAHDLPTLYKDFIGWFWNRVSGEINRARHEKQAYTSDLINIEFNVLMLDTCQNDVHIKTLSDLEKYRKSSLEVIETQISPFLIEINRAVETYGWVDIECIYYQLLKKILYEGEQYVNPTDLNKDLEVIEKLLVEYLTEVERLYPNVTIQQRIHLAIFGPILYNQCSTSGRDALIEFAKHRWEHIDDEYLSLRRLYNHGECWNDVLRRVKNNFNTFDVFWNEVKAGDKHSSVQNYMYPSDILYLNFNYTNTSNLYVRRSGIETIHIHGSLNDPNNPIVFGYGDEMDEHFKKILNLNDNAYLDKSKSSYYLNTDNYKRLLNFLESAPFQVVIIGHSCGNSDRTLLNTIFEHRNCISIKPCYHKKDGKDNYKALIQNISRNFHNMALMRDVVVCKADCDYI